MLAWDASPPGLYLRAWEQQRFDEALADIFGYYAVQLGNPGLDTLAMSRIQHLWHADLAAAEEQAVWRPDLRLNPAALPLDAASVDLVTLPRTLEQHVDPHTVLREVERVLVPEGRVAISGINPWSLWGLRHWRTGVPPVTGELIAPRRLRDWLRLLGFEVESARYGCWRPATPSARRLERSAWMDRLGPRVAPRGGGAYFLVAVKRVHGALMMPRGWKERRRELAGAPVSIAGKLDVPADATKKVPS
ncbi:MAG TPA: methyltransferase domain-containing protein [Burkholderiaceae bacterium]|mgnify:CR=1 FL=1|nr:methyltransferase domain-containing protein [Burkholderiaceae bacterium]